MSEKVEDHISAYTLHPRMQKIKWNRRMKKSSKTRISHIHWIRKNNHQNFSSLFFGLFYFISFILLMCCNLMKSKKLIDLPMFSFHRVRSRSRVNIHILPFTCLYRNAHRTANEKFCVILSCRHIILLSKVVTSQNRWKRNQKTKPKNYNNDNLKRFRCENTLCMLQIEY